MFPGSLCMFVSVPFACGPRCEEKPKLTWWVWETCSCPELITSHWYFKHCCSLFLPTPIINAKALKDISTTVIVERSDMSFFRQELLLLI